MAASTRTGRSLSGNRRIQRLRISQPP